MKKFLLLFLLVLNYSYAQIYNSPDDSGSQYLNLTPNSPQATELVRHGSVPVNLSTGQLNYTVPLYTIAASGFSWPINLSYNYSGLKAEARPSAAGLGWSLISGGVVTREVRGLPDEHPSGYFSTTSQMIVNDYVENETMNWYRIKDILAGKYDTEPDKFNVSAGGIHFSFKLKENAYGALEAVMLSPENYQVSFSWDEIRVTDDNGILYVFNQKEVHRGLDLPEDIYITDFSDSWTVSWFLSEIILKDIDEEAAREASHNKILFEYQNHSYRSRSFFASSVLNSTSITGPDGSIVVPQQSYRDGYTRTDVVQPSLKRISFPQGEVNFELNDSNRYPLYQQMQVSNQHDERIHTYDFSYEGSRRCLTKIDKNEEAYYAFDYYNTDKIIPFSDEQETVITAQDDWGYYNGQNDNEYVIDSPFSIYRANKFPYFEYTLAGALKTITYPSKGSTTIAYEQNQRKISFAEASNIAPSLQHRYKLQLGNRHIYKTTEETKIQTITLTKNAFAQLSSSEKTFGTGDKIRVSLRKVSPSGTTISSGNFETDAEAGRVDEPIPLITPHYDSGINYGGDAGGYNPDTGVFEYYSKTTSTRGLVKIGPGTYELLVTVKGKSEAEIKFSYVEVDDQINAASGGIRVAKTIDTNGAEKLTPDDITVYDYNDADGLSKGLKFHQEFKSVSMEALYYYNPHGPGSSSCVSIPYITKKLSYHTLNPVNTNSGLPIFYPEVKIYKNPQTYYNRIEEDFDCTAENTAVLNEDGSLRYELLYESDEQLGKTVIPINGYTLKKFKTPLFFDDSLVYPFKPIGTEKTGTVELESAVYGLDEFTNHPYLGSKSISEYDTIEVTAAQIDAIPAGIKVAERVHITGECEYVIPDELLSEFYYREQYRDHDISLYSDKTTNTTYSFQGDLIQSSTTETFYNDKNYVDHTRTSDSEGTAIQTKYSYAFQDGAPAGSHLLVAKNKIAQPVSTTGYKGSKIIGAQKRIYGNTHSYFPYVQELMIAKEDQNLNGDLSDDYKAVVEYFSYDEAGNPTELAQKDGTRIVYLWGYNYVSPIAKIENATLNEVLAALALEGDGPFSITADYAGLQSIHGAPLEDLFTKLRSLLPQSMISSFTYKPLVGVLSQTDPRGRRTTYQYDHQNRLELVIDHDGNVLEHNEYNIRAE